MKKAKRAFERVKEGKEWNEGEEGEGKGEREVEWEGQNVGMRA